MRRICGMGRILALTLGAVAIATFAVAPAAAQTGADDPEDGATARPWIEGRVSASAFGGRLSGATNIGSSEKLFIRTIFEQADDTVWGIRGGVRIWWRLHAEVEYLQGSPGIDAVLTDLQGRGRTEVSFAEMDLRYLAANARFDLTDARIRPFLSAGIASVTTESADLESANQDGVGVLFGGGVEVRILGPAIFRADIRGLRTDLELLGELASRGVTTQLIWTAGFGVRF